MNDHQLQELRERAVARMPLKQEEILALFGEITSLLKHNQQLADGLNDWRDKATAAGGSGDFALGSKVWPGTSKLLEEMGELQQVLGKLMQVAGSTEHWDGDLKPRLVDECADVAAALQVFTVENFTREELLQMLSRSEEKKVLFRKWHGEQAKDDRCPQRSPRGSRCQKPFGHDSTCHSNDGKYVEDWMNTP